jgi:hypothetical protein
MTKRAVSGDNGTAYDLTKEVKVDGRKVSEKVVLSRQAVSVATMRFRQVSVRDRTG